MKRIQLVIALVVVAALVTPASAVTTSHLWSYLHGGSGSDIGYGAAVDADGNLYVTGTFTGTANLGGANLISAGGNDIFLAKYDASGVHVWSQRFGGTSNDQGRAVAVDYLGNVYATGYFGLSVDFGGGAIASNGSSDIFLAKYDENGVHQWSQGFGGTLADQPNGLVADGGANVIMTGLFNGTVDFGGGNLVSAGSGDVFVAKYSAAGGHSWSDRYGSTGNDIGYDIDVDNLSRIVVTGRFNGTVDFGGGDLTSAGSTDIFLAKYAITGNHIWSQRFGGSGAEFAGKVDVGPDGTIGIAGGFRETATFGGDSLTAVGNTDIYLAAYDEDGGHLWSRGFGSANGDNGGGVGVDDLGNVYLAANFDETVDFGGGPLGEDSGADLAVAKYGTDGSHQWSGSYDASSHIFPNGLVLDAQANPVVTGYVSGTIDFGGGVLTSSANDAFLVKFGAPAEPVITSIADIGNDQGKKVKIRFDRSGRDDAASPTPVIAYDIYRRSDTPPSAPASFDGERGVRSQSYAAPAGWTFLASAPAHGESSYGIDVTTLADSTATHGQFWSVFYVRASTAAPTTFWDSPPDSGYSLDNLAPGMPSGASYQGGVVSWQTPSDPDIQRFTVYGASLVDFGAAVVIGYTTDESLDVAASPYAHYFVTAVDDAGNESLPASTGTPTGVSGIPSRYVLSVSNYPNPFNPATSVRYTVPSAGSVTIAVYDARGARVATLVDAQSHDAGAYRVAWDGRNASGATVTTGVYFARIEHAGSTQSRKMLLIK